MFRSRVDIAEERISEMIMSRSKYTIRKKWKIQKREETLWDVMNGKMKLCLNSSQQQRPDPPMKFPASV